MKVDSESPIVTYGLNKFVDFQFVEESKLDEAAGRDGLNTNSAPSKGSKASLRSDKSNNSEEVCRLHLLHDFLIFVCL